MRSRSCTTAAPEHGGIQKHSKGLINQQQVEEGQREHPDMTKGRIKAQRPEMEGRSATPKRAAKMPDLSKKELIHLLGVMEGEVQAREDIIRLLKSDRTPPETLEARYGSAAPSRPLQALQRDASLLHGNQRTDDVYEKPMAELDRLEDKQRETYRRMLEQLLLAEKCHRRTVTELDNEKRKHADFMNKSDDFTNLLEQERERLKRLLEQEKAYQTRRDKEHSRRLGRVQEELAALRSFLLMLVDERQLHIEQIQQQNQKIQDLSQKLQDDETRLAASTAAAEEDGRTALRLEAELDAQRARWSQEQEEAAARLARQVAENKQLRLELDGLRQKIEELEGRNQELQRSEEDLQELREKIGKGERGNSSLTAELENLRQKVLEMEGKDEEIAQMEGQCRELGRRLQEEEQRNKELRLEVEKVQRRMVELEKLEGAFGRSRAECSQLHQNLEQDRRALKELGGEAELLRARLKELETSESRLEEAEALLREELRKLKSVSVLLVEERKTAAERLKQEEQKGRDLSATLQSEQEKVTQVTEKLIEESRKLLKVKSEMEVRLEGLTQEKEELGSLLRSKEEECDELKEKLKMSAEGLEELERKLAQRNRDGEDLRVQEMASEMKRLKGRLEQLEVVEGDLMKSEDEYDVLEKKFRYEQDRADALARLVEEMKGQEARSRAAEAQLRVCCKVEEAKSRELRVQVLALKEKIHELLYKEDQLAQLQADFSVLQRRLLEEEQRRRSLTMEAEGLAQELEASRRYSRALRPGLHGRRLLDVPVASTGVQTEAPAEDETAAGFIRKSVQEENHLMSNLRQHGPKRPPVLDRWPPASAEPRGPSHFTPWTSRTPTRICSQLPGRPLHIRVTPDHETSTATLEITGPRANDFFSSTTIIPTLGLQQPRITIVPTSAAGTSKTEGWEAVRGPECATSPVTVTTISETRSPDRPSSSSPGGLRSPVSIITVSTTPVAEACASPDPHEGATRRTLIKMSSEKDAEPARKYNSNIITTEDNKIHIHLGPQFQRSLEGGSAPLLTLRPTAGVCDGQEAPVGAVLCSPRHSAAGSKMTSSITITPVTSAASRPTQSQLGPDVPSTRVPASRGLKLNGKMMVGVSAVTRLESRTESQAMKIELRKATLCSSASAGKT